MHVSAISPFATTFQMRSRSPEPVRRLHRSATLSSVIRLKQPVRPSKSFSDEQFTSPNWFFPVEYTGCIDEKVKSSGESSPRARTSRKSQEETSRSRERRDDPTEVPLEEILLQKLATLLHVACSILRVC